MRANNQRNKRREGVGISTRTAALYISNVKEYQAEIFWTYFFCSRCFLFQPEKLPVT